MRADARKNYDHLLVVARGVVAEQGAEASLRDIARRADVGLGTLYRHFPSREALLAALLRESFDALAVEARDLATSPRPDDALVSWMRHVLQVTRDYRGVVASMASAIEDPESALHASCVAMKAAGTRLLTRAQEEGMARTDVDGGDLFALMGALAWVGDQPSLAPRADRLISLIGDAILTNKSDGGSGRG